jgi:hypothetical protein
MREWMLLVQGCLPERWVASLFSMHCIELCCSEKGALWRLVIVIDLLAILTVIDEKDVQKQIKRLS